MIKIFAQAGLLVAFFAIGIFLVSEYYVKGAAAMVAPVTDAFYETFVLPQERVAHAPYVAKLQAAARRLGATGMHLSTDDLYEPCPRPPGVQPRIMGQAFLPRSDWEIVGSKRSARKECHYRIVTVWRFVGEVSEAELAQFAEAA